MGRNTRYTNRWKARNEKETETEKSFTGRRNGACKGPEAENLSARSPCGCRGKAGATRSVEAA